MVKLLLFSVSVVEIRELLTGELMTSPYIPDCAARARSYHTSDLSGLSAARTGPSQHPNTVTTMRGGDQGLISFCDHYEGGDRGFYIVSRLLCVLHLGEGYA